MAYIPGGSFYMGTDPDEIPDLLQRFSTNRREFFLSEIPLHLEQVKPFYLDRYEVTNAEFKAFVDANPRWRPDRIESRYHNGDYLKHWGSGVYPQAAADHPVTYISWQAAFAYCESQGKRLPTEAEWEYAARGGLAGEVFPWGKEMPDASRVNWSGSPFGGPTKVGSYPPNGFGVFDMAGNVWEFVQDEWRDQFAVKSDASSEAIDGKTDLGTVLTRRVIRGGSWGGSAINLRVRYRDSHPPTGAGNHVGFRCARPR